MGKKNKLKKSIEIRADTPPTPATEPEIASDVLLRALLDLDQNGMTREKALQIPTVQACLSLISNTISRLPIQLLRRKRTGDIEVIKKDPRVSLLNEDTFDTLTAKQFWRAMIEDYYLGRGGFAYINRHLNQVKSIHYVREDEVSIGFQNFNPIFKEYDILVQGTRYRPFDFLKLLRKTRDGMQSSSIIEESPLVLSVAYAELKFELANAKKGGAKRGFLQSEKNLSRQAIEDLKDGYRRLYGESDENVVVLNNGVKFQESSATAAELQMNENKQSNAEEICKLFGIPASMICGSRVGNSMSDNDMAQFTRACVAVMTDIECSLNRDLLLEEEVGKKYFQFDTKELTRGSIAERYAAYKIGLEKNFLQIDEVREKEGMEPLGIEWVAMNLNTVLYNTKTKEIYTPNTNAIANLVTGAGAKLNDRQQAGNTAGNSIEGATDPENSKEGGEKDESGTES